MPKFLTHSDKYTLLVVTFHVSNVLSTGLLQVSSITFCNSLSKLFIQSMGVDCSSSAFYASGISCTR